MTLCQRIHILQGEIIAIKNGHFVDAQEAAILGRELGDFSLQISDEFFICPKTKEEMRIRRFSSFTLVIQILECMGKYLMSL
jgi:hypothetical protein